MSFLDYFFNLFNKIKARFKRDSDLTANQNVKDDNESVSNTYETKPVLTENFSFIQNNNLIDNIKLIRTKLSRIEIVCPSEFIEFNDRLNKLEQLCNKEYQDYIECIRNDKLTFNCDPTFNSDLSKKVNFLQLEIDEFISKIAVYRLLQERLEKMYSELKMHYYLYAKGEFKGNFKDLILKAEETLSNVIKRVVEEDEIKNSSMESFFEKKSLNDVYLKILYTILKCYIRYFISINQSYDEVSDLFNEQYLFYIMKDLESFRKDIESLKATNYYERLNVEFKKLKSVNISDLDIVLNTSFWVDFLHLENNIIYARHKKTHIDVENQTEDILTKLNS